MIIVLNVDTEMCRCSGFYRELIFEMLLNDLFNSIKLTTTSVCTCANSTTFSVDLVEGLNVGWGLESRDYGTITHVSKL